MNELNTDQLFEMAKNAPTELSRDQIVGFIQTIPTLPGGSGGSWFQNFNLNSIIMTTTTVTIIGSALVYFLNQSPQPELPVQEVPTDKIEMVTSDSTQDESEKIPVLKATSPEIKAENAPEEKPENSDIEATEKPANKPVAKLSSPSTRKPQSEPQKETPKPDPILELDPDERMVSTLSETESETRKLSPDKLRKLKREFLRFIDKDGLTTDKKDINELTYAPNGISVNDKPLEASLVGRYTDLMKKYGVQSGIDQKIVAHADYIMVGRFTEEGFKGQALGKNMNIEFADDRTSKDGLFGLKEPGEITSIPKPTMFASSPNTGLKDNLVPPASGRKIIPSTTENPKLIGSNGASPSKEKRLIPEKNPTKVPIGKKRKPVELNGKTIKQLKRILYQNLVNDDLISHRNDPVRMLIGPEGINVNGEFLNTDLNRKYIQILAQFSVVQAKGHKILLSSDFIFVGKFTRDRFSGSVQGNLDPETIKGTILEEDLLSLSFFNDINKFSTQKGAQVNGKFNLDGQEDSEEFAKKATEEREISEFHTVMAKGVSVVYISTEKHQKARLVVSGMPIEDVLTRVRDGVLMVDTRGNPQGESIEVYVSSPNLKEIEVAGAAEIYSDHKITTDDLKVSSTDVGAAFLNVNTNNLVVTMSGGDLELKGQTKYLDILYEQGAERGTLDYDGLRVDLKNSNPDDELIKKELPHLRVELIEQLLLDKLIQTSEDQITIDFTRASLAINGKTIAEDKMNEYRGLLAKYGILLQNQRKIFTKAPFIILADRSSNGTFKFVGDGGGKKVNISIKKNWEEQEKAIFREN